MSTNRSSAAGASAAATDAAPWRHRGSPAAASPRRRVDWGRALPLVGPLALLIVWDLVVRVGWIKPILLPPPVDTLLTLINGMASPVLLPHFLVTLERTLLAFGIATAIGMPLGIVLYILGTPARKAARRRAEAAPSGDLAEAHSAAPAATGATPAGDSAHPGHGGGQAAGARFAAEREEP